MARSLQATLLISLFIGSSALAANSPLSPLKTTELLTISSIQTLLGVVAPIQMGRLSPELRITQHLVGSCATASMADSGRTDAWRCTVNNIIYDPCFGENEKLVCLTSPWSKEAIELITTKPLPTSTNETFKPGHGTPWGLELANGERCTLLTGATGSFAGMRATYACGKDGLVYGELDKSHEQWKVFYQSNDDVAIKQIPVVTAWY